MADFDLTIIGGGINGIGIARDAAGGGLCVLLIEQKGLASGTSSASSKLIHGGPRYLEHAEIGLVRAALQEREILLRTAPHLLAALRFVLPIHQARRSALALRLDLLVYDWLGSASSCRQVASSTSSPTQRQPLRRVFGTPSNISDRFADDARLVVLNALDDAERGASIRTRTRCDHAIVLDKARGEAPLLSV